MKLHLCLAALVCALASTALSQTQPRLPLPGPDLNLKLAAPIKTWDEAIPLGNGTMGVLLWGETNLLRLSLDRGDLWDERPSKRFTEVRDKFNWAAMQRMVAENKMAEFHDVFDSNYDYNGPPTKLPAGRVEITLDPSQKVEAFELNLATAEGIAKLAGGHEARAFVSAASVSNPVALVRISGPALKELRLKSPDSVKKLGYPPPRAGEGEGLRWFEQEAADGFAYAICVAWKRVGNETLLAVTVATRAEGKSPHAVAQARVEAALKAGYATLLAEHAQWWAAFWSHSRITIPESHLLQHYYLVRYFYGAASRRGAPPMPLQGVWSADAGSLPPWKGDYHNDLNTQMTYIAYRTSGDNDEGLCFLDYLWDRLPTFRQFAQDFYGTPGAAVPGVMSLAGQPLGGWGQYSLSPTMGAWNAHLFYLHWRHTGDDQFLRDRAYPFCREIAVCLQALLKPDTNGVLVLPLSSSPEIFDNTRRAFLTPNSNYDLASLKMLFLALAEMAEARGEQKDAANWLATAKQLGAFHAKADGTLLLDESNPLPGSHRHLSNLMPLHPFNLITGDGGARDREIITASLKDWDSKGTSGWCGYSFSWMACLRARVGDAEAALRNLDIYARAFILRNGFHANGDQTKSGFSGMTYRPFTLEGNFLAMEAVHEMLLQSWNSLPGEVRSSAFTRSAEPPEGGTPSTKPDFGPIRLFPATPWRWHDASFDDLRAEGGHRVSARRENNATTWFRVLAGSDGPVRIRDNFGERTPQWSRKGVKKIGDNYQVALQRGEILEATLPKPKEIPPAPANAAEPVVIRKHSAITPNKLPLRIGADSQGNNQFSGAILLPAVFGRALGPDEVRELADSQTRSVVFLRGCLVALQPYAKIEEIATRFGYPVYATNGMVNAAVASLKPTAVGSVKVNWIRETTQSPQLCCAWLEGGGFLEFPYYSSLDCPNGLTLAAWIKPAQFPPGGMRIIDKSPVGEASGYLLDTYPGNSLRLITRDPHLIYQANLPTNQWSHVAATVDGQTGKQILYLNGKPVAESP
jgi:alpha-L-fucosidase 2